LKAARSLSLQFCAYFSKALYFNVDIHNVITCLHVYQHKALGQLPTQAMDQLSQNLFKFRLQAKYYDQLFLNCRLFEFLGILFSQLCEMFPGKMI